jgi:hypothetical protein
LLRASHEEAWDEETVGLTSSIKAFTQLKWPYQ